MKKSMFVATRSFGALFALGIAFMTFLAGHPASAQSYTYSAIYSFAGGTGDGEYPTGTLVQGSDGEFRGTTTQGGVYSGGLLFKISQVGSEYIEANFHSTTNGALPASPQFLGSDGDYYGVAQTGGTNGDGTAYKFTASGTSGSILHDFSYSTDGHGPNPLIQASDGNWYGTCNTGGANGDGTAFKMTSSGTVTVLHSFGSGSDGQNPVGALIQASDGNLYGTTSAGGSNSEGIVFKLTTSGTETVLHSFGATNDGSMPEACLIQASDGNLYGTTYDGGADSDGTVFKITTGGTETVLYSFAGYPSDGANPFAGLVQAASGNFYGTTFNGGNGYGTVFMVTTGGTESVAHSFTNTAPDGEHPEAGLIVGSNGILYGTTYYGGTSGLGVLFSLAAPL